MRILIAEDDYQLRQSVARGLREASYAVDEAVDGAHALELAMASEYDVIILDVLMPRHGGLEVCRSIREHGSQVPILMLTALDTVEDKIAGLDAGADDYLTKPFDFGELLARLRALTRRRGEVLSAELMVGDLVIDTRRQSARRGAREIPLTMKEFAFLQHLARNAGRIVSRVELMAHLWDDSRNVYSNIIDVYASRLRRKIDEGEEVALFTTHRGAGHMLAVPVGAPAQSQPQPALPRRPSDQPNRRARPSGRTDAMRWWPSLLRVRLTFWFTLVLGAPLIAFAVGSYVIFQRTLVSRTDQFMRDALSAFSRELVAERRLAPTTDRAVRTTLDEVRFRELQILILDDSARVLGVGVPADPVAADRPARSPIDVRLVLEALRRQTAAAGVALTLPDSQGGFRVRSRPFVLGGESIRIVGAYPLRDVADILSRIRRAFLVAIPLLLISAALGGYFLAKRSLSPVSAMGARAAEISATNLHERLPVASSADELGGLATVINDLLDRLERAFAQQRRFMADASHELRTPTAILRSEADVTLSREHRSEGEYRESVVVMQDAANRLTRIVDDLFLLARADAGHLVVRQDQLYLEEIVHGATRGVRNIADRRDVRVVLRPVIDAPLRGDADLLGRLVLNLLDNAIKHSPRGAAVDVELALRSGKYEISVVDSGSGILPEAQERIFERFFRVDVARSRSETTETSGAGLGLAIARHVAEAHGGRLELVQSRPGHTEFRITLPVNCNEVEAEAEALST